MSRKRRLSGDLQVSAAPRRSTPRLSEPRSAASGACLSKAHKGSHDFQNRRITRAHDYSEIPCLGGLNLVDRSGVEERPIRSEEGTSKTLYLTQKRLNMIKDDMWKSFVYPSPLNDQDRESPSPVHVSKPAGCHPSSVRPPATPVISSVKRPISRFDKDPWELYNTRAERWDIETLRGQAQVASRPPVDGVGYEAGPACVDETTLSEEQRTILKHVRAGKNVFISGSAGKYERSSTRRTVSLK
jgi:hypothetical protein